MYNKKILPRRQRRFEGIQEMVTHCPDCGEPLAIHRGVVPLTGTAFCPECQWCEVADGDRGRNAEEDYLIRFCQEVDLDPDLDFDDLNSLPHSLEGYGRYADDDYRNTNEY